MMTSGCSETVTEGTTLGLAITLFSGNCDGSFDTLDSLNPLGPALLVDASSMLSSVSTSILSFDAVTGIILTNITLSRSIIENRDCFSGKTFVFYNFASE